MNVLNCPKFSKWELYAVGPATSSRTTHRRFRCMFPWDTNCRLLGLSKQTSFPVFAKKMLTLNETARPVVQIPQRLLWMSSWLVRQSRMERVPWTKTRVLLLVVNVVVSRELPRLVNREVDSEGKRNVVGILCRSEEPVLTIWISWKRWGKRERWWKLHMSKASLILCWWSGRNPKLELTWQRLFTTTIEEPQWNPLQRMQRKLIFILAGKQHMTRQRRKPTVSTNFIAARAVGFPVAGSKCRWKSRYEKFMEMKLPAVFELREVGLRLSSSDLTSPCESSRTARANQLSNANLASSSGMRASDTESKEESKSVPNGDGGCRNVVSMLTRYPSH